MLKVIDTPTNCTDKVPCLLGANVGAVIRYYARATNWPSKRLKPDEAVALTNAGIRIAVVHQGAGNSPQSFSKALGVSDAQYSREYATQEIGQPADSAIYFAVDYDATQTQVTNRVVPYFEGVREAFQAANGLSSYRVGVYGSGLVCRTLLDNGLVEFTWLSQSTGHAEHQQFKASGRWNLVQGPSATMCSGAVDYDPDTVNSNRPNFGQFVLGAPVVGPTPGEPAVGRNKVVAASGLRLRGGPGTEFAVIRLLPFGTIVNVVRIDGDWAFVDLQEDGAIDGAVFARFLVRV